MRLILPGEQLGVASGEPKLHCDITVCTKPVVRCEVQSPLNNTDFEQYMRRAHTLDYSGFDFSFETKRLNFDDKVDTANEKGQDASNIASKNEKENTCNTSSQETPQSPAQPAAADPAPEPLETEQVVQEETVEKTCKRSAAFIRVGEVLKNAKAARLAKENIAVSSSTAAEAPATCEPEPSKEPIADAAVATPTCETSASKEPLADAAVATPTCEPEPSKEPEQLAVADAAVATPLASAELPQLPSDWASTSFVSPEQQQTPKKRGRKPKDKDVKEPKAKAEPKRSQANKRKDEQDGAAKAEDLNAAPKRRARKDKPEASLDKAAATDSKADDKPPTKRPRKAKTTSSEPAPSKPSAKETLEMLPVPKEARANVKQLKTTKPKKGNIPSKYEPHVETDDCNESDKHAVEAMACDVAKLKAPQEETKDTKDADEQYRILARKQALSRKSCAYKKARNLARKAGQSEEEAIAAAKKVTPLCSNIFLMSFLKVCFAVYNL